MLEHPATIELIEKLGELAKNFGSLLVRYAQRLKTEPIKQDVFIDHRAMTPPDNEPAKKD